MLSTDEMLMEYAKIVDDPVYGIETYLETFDRTQEGYVPFNLFPRQKEIIAAYNEHRFNLITKPRQAGVSTTTAAFAAIKVAIATKNNPEAILILANKQDMALEFLAKIKEFLQQLPRWIWGPGYTGSEDNLAKSIFNLKDSQKEIKLPNGSRVKAVATSKDALRGYNPSLLIMDEAAFIDNGDTVFGAALTALGTGGRATLISTPNGMDALYHKTYDESIKGKNDFNVIEMKWYEDYRYNRDLRWIKKSKDENLPDEVVVDSIWSFENNEKMLKTGYKPTSTWYEEMCRGMNNNARMIAQELDVSFIGSGGNVINDEFIIYQETVNVEEPIMTKGSEKEFRIWREPVEGHQYILGSDVARGDGEDTSTIVIIDFTTMEQVFEYQGKIQPDLLAQVIYEYGNLYNAYSVVDNIGVGASTVVKLMELEYKHLHYDMPQNKLLTDTRSFMSYAKGTKIPGFCVNNVRLPMVAHLEYCIRENTVAIRSKRLTSEMKTFIYKNGRPDHQSGFHDDLIMALAMCLWVMEHSFKNLEKLEKQSKAMLNSWVVGSGTADDGTGFVPKGSKGKALPKPKFSDNVSKNMQDPKGTYSWLFSGMR